MELCGCKHSPQTSQQTGERYGSLLGRPRKNHRSGAVQEVHGPRTRNSSEVRCEGSRGGKFKILEGPEKFARFVVVEFPSMEEAIACHDSAEYQAAAAFRQDGGGEVELVIVDGGEATPT